jgi:hypothetical protein
MFAKENFMRLFFLICLFFFGINKLSADESADNIKNPPEKMRILERIESSKWINSSSKWLLRNHSNKLLSREDIETLSSLNKSKLLKNSEIGTAGVLLYEFATGDGASTRYFTDSTKFTESVSKSPGMSWIAAEYLRQYDTAEMGSFDSSLNMFNVRYQFSPSVLPLKLNTWEFSLMQHFETWERKSFSQIILGSYNADLQCINDSTIRVHIWNKTSKKSLFAGFGKRWQRPLILGTTEQHVVFNLTRSQMISLVHPTNL